MGTDQTTPVIVSAVRTPVGKFLGGLAALPAPRLGALVIKEAVRRAGVDAAAVDEVIMGNVLQGGVGQAPARQAAIHAGLPGTIPSLTVNKVCGSGLKAVVQAYQSIALGEIDVAVAGGMESMSNAPYFSPAMRSGARMGNVEMKDLMIHDGLWDPYDNMHMGNCGELCAKERGISTNGFRTVFNTNRDGGQTVPHIHLHLLGGRGMHWPPG